MLRKHHLDLYNYDRPIENKSMFWLRYMRGLRGAGDDHYDTRTSRYSPRPSYQDRIAEIEREIRNKALDAARERERYSYTRPRSTYYSLPMYTRSGYRRSPPLGFYHDDVSGKTGAGIDKDPWWWSFPNLRPIYLSSPIRNYLPRYSYLSPIKRSYLWDSHPARHSYSYSYRY